MWQVFLASLLLSGIHAAVPNHWVPLVALGKTEKWGKEETLAATVITGFSHTLSTVIIGIIVGFIGYKLSEYYQSISRYAPPAILLGLGIIYICMDLYNTHKHKHSHTHEHLDIPPNKKTKAAILTSLSIAMFLTPCAEIEAYYFQAGRIGWTGIWIVSAVYTFSTVVIMLVLVYLGMKGVSKLKSHFLEHHEKRVTGMVLIVFGVLAMFIGM